MSMGSFIADMYAGAGAIFTDVFGTSFRVTTEGHGVLTVEGIYKDKLAKLGMTWNQIIDPEDLSLRNPVEIMREMEAGYENVKHKVDGLRGAQNLFNDELGVYVYRLLESGEGNLNRLLVQHDKLTGYRAGDAEAARDYQRAIVEEKAAIDGLTLSFFRGYTENARYASIDRSAGFAGARDKIEDLGRAFGHVTYVITPALIKALEGGAIHLADLFDYLATGETDAEWIGGIATGIDDAKASIAGFKADASGAFASFERISTDIEARILPAIDRIAPSFERSMAVMESTVIPGIIKVNDVFAGMSNFVENQVIPVFGVTLSQAMTDIIGLISTGDTEAPWLSAIMTQAGEFITDLTEVFSIVNMVKDGIYQLADFVTQTVLPTFCIDVSSVGLIAGFVLLGVSLTKIIPLLGSAWGMLKTVDGVVGTVIHGFFRFFGLEIGTKSGLVASFVVIKGLLADALMSVGALIGKLGQATGATAVLSKAGGAAVAAAGGGKALLAGGAFATAAIGGTYVAVSSAEDLRTRMEGAEAKQRELAATHGEEYAAAYYRAVVERIRDESGAAGLISDFMGIFGGGIDYDKAFYELDEVIAKGGSKGADAAVAGAAAAFRDHGWEVESDGSILIGGGLAITSARLTDAIQADVDGLKQLDMEINVSSMSGIDEVIEREVERLRAGSDMSAVTRPMSDFAGEQAAADRQPTGGAPVIFQFGMESEEMTVSPASSFNNFISRGRRGGF